MGQHEADPGKEEEAARDEPGEIGPGAGIATVPGGRWPNI